MRQIARREVDARGDHGWNRPFPHLGALVAGFARAPTAVASPFPSSSGLVRRLLDRADWRDMGTVVEFGPGSGALTRALLARIRHDARLVAIDTDPGLTRYLATTIADRRLNALSGSALDVRAMLARLGIDRADCIVSGIPFSGLAQGQRRLVLEESARLLGASGVFLAYQMRRSIEPGLHQIFARVERQRYWLNLPPCYLYFATGAKVSRLGTRSKCETKIT